VFKQERGRHEGESDNEHRYLGISIQLHMTNQDRTEKYHLYFQEQLTSIQNLETRLHKKILLVIILDTLSRARYPSVRGVKERFLKVINEHAKWEHAHRVSLYQVFLSLTPAMGNALRKLASGSVNQWRVGTMPGLEADPLITDIEHLAYTEKERKLLRESTHSNLLYLYRNHLVHEFREPGNGVEKQGDISPYYHSLTHLTAKGGNKKTWELVYPLGFFMQLALTSLDSLKHYLMENDLDPYSFYQFGTIWKRTV
jgi:hypothetical protein